MDWDEKFIHCLANQYGSRMVSQQHPVGTKSRIDDDVVINCEPRIYMISHRRLHPRFLPSEWSMQRDSVTNFDFSLILLYVQTVVSTCSESTGATIFSEKKLEVRQLCLHRAEMEEEQQDVRASLPINSPSAKTF
jgi:hypothetical protein